MYVGIKLNSEAAAQWEKRNPLQENQMCKILKKKREGLIEVHMKNNFQSFLYRCSQHSTRRSGAPGFCVRALRVNHDATPLLLRSYQARRILPALPRKTRKEKEKRKQYLLFFLSSLIEYRNSRPAFECKKQAVNETQTISSCPSPSTSPKAGAP